MLWRIALWLMLWTQPSLIVHPDGWAGSERIADSVAVLKQTTDYTILTSEDYPAGGHDLSYDNQIVIMAGGYFRACYANAVRDVFCNSENCVVVIPMNAVYQGASRTLYEHYQDNFQSNEEFVKYIESVARNQFGIEDPVIVLYETLIVVY